MDKPLLCAGFGGRPAFAQAYVHTATFAEATVTAILRQGFRLHYVSDGQVGWQAKNPIPLANFF